MEASESRTPSLPRGSPLDAEAERLLLLSSSPSPFSSSTSPPVVVDDGAAPADAPDGPRAGGGYTKALRVLGLTRALDAEQRAARLDADDSAAAAAVGRRDGGGLQQHQQQQPAGWDDQVFLDDSEDDEGAGPGGGGGAAPPGGGRGGGGQRRRGEGRRSLVPPVPGPADADAVTALYGALYGVGRSQAGLASAAGEGAAAAAAAAAGFAAAASPPVFRWPSGAWKPARSRKRGSSTASASASAAGTPTPASTSSSRAPSTRASMSHAAPLSAEGEDAPPSSSSSSAVVIAAPTPLAVAVLPPPDLAALRSGNIFLSPGSARVSVAVIDVSLRDGGVGGSSPHSVYLVRVRCGLRTWLIQRRYREFSALHRCLATVVPASRLPQLPGKLLGLSRTTVGVGPGAGTGAGGAVTEVAPSPLLAQRMVELQAYLRLVVRCREAWLADELLAFLDDAQRTLALQAQFARCMRMTQALAAAAFLQDRNNARLAAEAAAADDELAALNARLQRIGSLLLDQMGGGEDARRAIDAALADDDDEEGGMGKGAASPAHSSTSSAAGLLADQAAEDYALSQVTAALGVPMPPLPPPSVAAASLVPVPSSPTQAASVAAAAATSPSSSSPDAQRMRLQAALGRIRVSPGGPPPAPSAGGGAATVAGGGASDPSSPVHPHIPGAKKVRREFGPMAGGAAAGAAAASSPLASLASLSAVVSAAPPLLPLPQIDEHAEVTVSLPAEQPVGTIASPGLRRGGRDRSDSASTDRSGVSRASAGASDLFRANGGFGGGGGGRGPVWGQSSSLR
jgi:hypothetical protein